MNTERLTCIRDFKYQKRDATEASYGDSITNNAIRDIIKQVTGPLKAL